MLRMCLTIVKVTRPFYLLMNTSLLKRIMGMSENCGSEWEKLSSSVHAACCSDVCSASSSLAFGGELRLTYTSPSRLVHLLEPSFSANHFRHPFPTHFNFLNCFAIESPTCFALSRTPLTMSSVGSRMPTRLLSFTMAAYRTLLTC